MRADLELGHQDLEIILELIEGRVDELYTEVRRSKGISHEDLKFEKLGLITLRDKICELLENSTKQVAELDRPKLNKHGLYQDSYFQEYSDLSSY